MTVAIHCTACKRQLLVQENLLGKTVICTHCQAAFEAHASDKNPVHAPKTSIAPVLAIDEASLNPPPGNSPTQESELASSASASSFSALVESFKKQLPPLALQVFGIAGGILVLAAVVGYVIGSWVADRVAK